MHDRTTHLVRGMSRSLQGGSLGMPSHSWPVCTDVCIGSCELLLVLEAEKAQTRTIGEHSWISEEGEHHWING